MTLLKPPRNFQISVRAAGFLVATAILGTFIRIQAADHKDSPATMEGNLDINDLYVFSRGDSMVMVMTVHPFLTPGSATQGAYFNPEGLYQFKLDKDRDGVEEAVIQVTFSGTGNAQMATVRGPGAPRAKGTARNALLKAGPMTGKFNETFSAGGMSVFAGPRDDPFFLHLMGDSSLTSVLNGAFSAALDTMVGQPGQQTLAFSKTGVDDFRGANILAIALKMPKAVLMQELDLDADGTFYVWATTSIKD